MPEISAVIITFNEEKNIARCLESLQGVADEIVVVDSYSTDKTEKICRGFGVKFVQHPFDGHIEQKNWALTQSTYPHVLSLDADEALSEELRQSVLNVKENWEKDGYSFNRLTNYCGQWIRHCGWYPDRKLRLWDKRKGSWQGVNPHDQYLMEDGATTGFLKGDLYHYSYYSISQHVTQANYFTDIAAREAFEKGKTSGICRIFLSPVVKFIKDYFIKLGLLDGYYGFVICQISANATFLKYIKLRQLHKQQKHLR